jgi:hypothetical protein
VVPFGVGLDGSQSFLHSSERTGSQCVVDHGSRSVDIYNELKELGRAERLRNGKRDDIYKEIAQDLYHLVKELILNGNRPGTQMGQDGRTCRTRGEENTMEIQLHGAPRTPARRRARKSLENC